MTRFIPVLPETPVLEPTADLILDPGDPLPSAREFVARHFTHGTRRTLHHRGGTFYAWNGAAYGHTDDAAIRAALYKFTEPALRWHVTPGAEPTLLPFKPTTAKIGNILDALEAVANLPNTITPPAWLTDDEDRPPARELLACRNGLLHLPTGKLLPPTPLFFGVNGVEYGYDPDAPEPAAWLDFLSQLWPEDQQQIDTLQEVIGLLLTPDTSHHKIFLVVTPRRGGKGTIGRVIGKLIGEQNVCAPTLAQLATNFGCAPLIDKSLVIVGDARLGGRADQHAIAERLLSISGDDAQTIDRKHRDAWTGKLNARFLILTNELPRLADASGTLASRFIVLSHDRTWYGREDHQLLQRLIAELPGILNWAIVGWHRLNQRGRFIQPDAAAEAIAELEDLGSPVAAFVRDRCIVTAAAQIDRDHLFAEWRSWCTQQGRDHAGTKATFGRDLIAAVPGIHRTQPRIEGGRGNLYEGIGLQ